MSRGDRKTSPARDTGFPSDGGNVVFVDHLGDKALKLSAPQVHAAFDLSHRIRSHDWTTEKTLGVIFENLRGVIPFHRLGLALINSERRVVSHHALSTRRLILGPGFEEPLAGSSLGRIAERGVPRLIRNLPRYLEDHPHSTSTAWIIAEGFRSSLTCPIFSAGKPVGFLFFTSERVDAFCDADILLLAAEITPLVARVMERDRLRGASAGSGAIDIAAMDSIRHELASARRAQSQMNHLNPDLLPGLDVALNYSRVNRVGGDIIDIVPCATHSYLILVADAMGHGAASAMVISSVKGAFRVASQHASAPDAVLGQLNVSLCETLPMFPTTAVCCRVDLVENSAAVASAGHYLPVHYRAAADEVIEQGDTGLPLGVERGEQYPLRQFGWEAADKLAFYTDGVVEAQCPAKQMYGRKRLIETIRRSAAGSAMQTLQTVWRDLQSHHRGQKPCDDMVFLVVGRAESVAARP